MKFLKKEYKYLLFILPAFLIYTIITHFVTDTPHGWASTSCIICFLSGMQMMSIGVIGEYIGKIYLETKQRPRYIISDRCDGEDQKN